MPAVEPDEAGPGEHSSPGEIGASLLEQDHLLVPTLAERVHQAPAVGELGGERRGNGGEGGRDQDRIVGSVLRQPLAAVTGDDRDVRLPASLQPLARRLGQVGPSRAPTAQTI